MKVLLMNTLVSKTVKHKVEFSVLFIFSTNISVPITRSHCSKHWGKEDKIPNLTELSF